MGPKAGAAEAERKLELLADHFDTVVVSDENLPGLMPGRSTQAFEARDRLAAVLRQLAAHHVIFPLVIVRDHASWLASLHRVHQSRGGVLEFQHFVDRIDQQSLAFAPLLRKLDEACKGRLIVGDFTGIAGNGGSQLLVRLGQVLGVGDRLVTSLPRKNAAQPPLMRALAAEVSKRGATFVASGAVDLRRLAAKLAADPSLATDRRIRMLARLVAERSVLLPDGLSGAIRVRMADSLRLTPGFKPALTVPDAMAAVRSALASLDQPLAPPGYIRALSERFAEDRRWIGQHYLPRWKEPPE